MALWGLQISSYGLLFGASVLLATLILDRLFSRNNNSPSVFYSNTNEIEKIDKTLKVKISFLPNLLKKIAYALFILAICNPIISKPHSQNKDSLKAQNEDTLAAGHESAYVPTEGLAIYFVLDQSGSMREEINFKVEGLTTRRATRIDALKFFTSQFISGDSRLSLLGRHDDLIGIVSFARVPKIISPLTLDHQEVLSKLKDFKPVTHPIEQGTAIGYAIYKTAHTIAATQHFSKEIRGNDKPAYDIKSTVMVLITDGLQNPANDDLEHHIRRIGVKEAALFAKEKGIRLYIINIQPSLSMVDPRNNRADQQAAAELTGGKFYLASDAGALHRIYKAIDSLERSKHYGTKKHQMSVEEGYLTANNNIDFIYLAFYLLPFAMALLLMAIILETTILKRVP